MAEEGEQRVPSFGTPLNYTGTIRMRRLRRAVGRRRAIELAGMYAHMRDLAGQARVRGEFSTEVESFVESAGGEPPTTNDDGYLEWFADQASVWQAFADAGLIEIEGDPTCVDRTFRVRVVDFDETNDDRRGAPVMAARVLTPVTIDGRAPEALKKAKQRHRARIDAGTGVCGDAGKCAVCGEVSPGQSRDVPNVPDGPGTSRDTVPSPPLPLPPGPPIPLAPTPPPACASAHEAVDDRIVEAIKAVAEHHGRPDVWLSHIEKLRIQFPGATEDDFVEALLATIRPSEAGEIKRRDALRAWGFLRGCVQRSCKVRAEAVEQHQARTTFDTTSASKSFAAFMAGGGEDVA